MERLSHRHRVIVRSVGYHCINYKVWIGYASWSSLGGGRLRTPYSMRHFISLYTEWVVCCMQCFFTLFTQRILEVCNSVATMSAAETDQHTITKKKKRPSTATVDNQTIRMVHVMHRLYTLINAMYIFSILLTGHRHWFQWNDACIADMDWYWPVCYCIKWSVR